MSKYNHKEVEKKWKKNWEESGIYKTKETSGKPKYYVLDMFPYPSGAGLHVGHPKGYIATDIVARMKMMQGFNVLHPMGWDAFGLPAENYALKNKVHPSEGTAKNVATFKKQLGLLGFTYDWDREVNTTDPKYYQWTQWIFLQMFKRGLAFESFAPINWCPDCKTGLANEDLEGGLCERCGSEIERKPMRQWVLRITDYAEKLLSGLDTLTAWPEHIKKMQSDWIGKSEGAEVDFATVILSTRSASINSTKDPLKSDERDSSATPQNDEVLKVFTTRPDTLFGATYMVIAPEHPFIQSHLEKISNKKEVQEYLEKAKSKSDLERTELQKEKTGVELKGVKAVNPANDSELPIFVADYVLYGYGTGAIMSVPAHDERDFEFAQKYNLPIKQVVAPLTIRETGADAFKKDMPIKERDAVVCVVKHWSEDKYMGIRWNNTYWQGFVIGGIEQGEEPGVTGAREVAEETGYKNVEFVKTLGSTVHAKFFQGAKQENRFAHFVPLLFQLKDGEQSEIDEKEKAMHEVKWLAKEEMNAFVSHEDMKIIWERAKGNEMYSGDGILMNSGKFDGMDSQEAKKAIAEMAGGKMKTNYKLRDWVFSRQRYWGEPIPLVHCEDCKNRKYNYVIIHGYGSDSHTGFKPWLKESLEKEGHKVYSPDLPNIHNPNIEEQVQYILGNVNFEINENTILVGHSLGAVVIYKLLEKINKPIAKTVFVDPVYKPEFNDEDRPAVTKSNDWKFDWKKIKNNCKDFIVLGDKKHLIIKKEHLDELSSNLEAKLLIVEPKEIHFSNHRENRITEEPDVLKSSMCDGWISVPEDRLPLELPKVKNYEPSGTGESPLATITDWVNTTCPKCGGPAKRETNTMPQWAGSCWYYLRYEDPHNEKELVNKDKEKYWSPIDLYVGGAEHATRHLIYARFWHKFLFDIGAVNYPEPFTRLQNVGLILAEDGRKMSKRWNNVINPDEVVEEYGADAMRLYEMFMGPFDQPCAWSTKGVVGVRRFLERVWNLSEKINVIPVKTGIQTDLTRSPIKSGMTTMLHQTIQKVSADIEGLRFNTAISSMMELTNEFGKNDTINKDDFATLLKLLSPFAPHVCEQLWSELGNKESIFESAWPQYDAELAKDTEITLAIQINGKLRDTLTVSADITDEAAKSTALSSEKVQKWLEGKEPKKVIYVKGKLVSIVV